VNIPVEKRWALGASGESAVIELVRNGEATGQTITLTEDNDWKGVFENLPKYDNQGNEITYSVTEQTSDWLFTVTSDGNGGYIVTNYPNIIPSLPNTGGSTSTSSTSLPSTGGTPFTGDVTDLGSLGILALVGVGVVATAKRLRGRDEE
jgi:hypothetical protein